MVKVYVIDADELNNKITYDKAYSLLDADRKAKVDKIASIANKKVSICAGLLLKYALKKEGILDYKVLTNENGKPFILDVMHFSISHSDNMCVVAISNEEIGVDIEKSDDVNIAIARRFFTEPEAVKVEEAVDPKNMFYKFWTLKEAAIKNQGLNISALGNFDFSSHSDEEEFEMRVDNIDYYYKHFVVDSFHYALSSLDKIRMEYIKTSINEIL